MEPRLIDQGSLVTGGTTSSSECLVPPPVFAAARSFGDSLSAQLHEQITVHDV